MADFGVGVSIPNGSGPSQAPQPVPQPASPPADQGHPFNEDALSDAFDKTFGGGGGQAQGNQVDQNDVQVLTAARSNPTNQATGNPNQWASVNAAGTPGQLAQASLGRNINERLQIWSKLVGDSNAMIGPPIAGQNDIWIRGKDDKFHPADTGHTDFLQYFAKKTGAGIDLAVTSLAAFGGAAIGTAAAAPEIGAALGYAAGPGLSSAGREFMMSRMYDVKSKAPGELVSGQLKRDAAIGGALNLFMGSVMSGMARVGDTAAGAISEGPTARAGKIAEAQQHAQNFMDAVGARPRSIITENGIEKPMSDAGSRLISATQYKRQQLNDLIGAANDQIISASNEKVNTFGLASVVKDFMKKDGYQFDDHGMPIPYQDIPVGAQEAGDAPLAMVSQANINRPKMGTQAMNDLSEDYKALASGKMDMDGFLKMTREWQENANFKPLDVRSDSTRAGWAQLQSMATRVRQNEIQTRLSNDPELLSSVNNAYHEYSSSQDAINMILDAYKRNQNSPEALANTFIKPGKERLLSQAQSLFADQPQVMKDVRSAWLSEKMGKHVGPDGVFNANTFMSDLRGTGGETLNQLFKPEELGSIYRAAKIMGNVKSNDLITQSQGQNVVDALGDIADKTSSFSFARPQAILKWLENKPKLADYVSSPEGLSKLAAQKDPTSAAILNNISSALRNKILQSTATEMIKSTRPYKSFSPNFVGAPEVQSMPQGSQGSDAAASQVFK